MQTKNFQRRIEDFACANCGVKVKGNGYTDHCPSCLYSLHVDEMPGDRVSICKMLMKPVGAETKNDRYVIYYLCKCGYRHRVKSAADDDLNKILELSGMAMF